MAPPRKLSLLEVNQRLREELNPQPRSIDLHPGTALLIGAAMGLAVWVMFAAVVWLVN
jgi:hypothetical protein